MSITTAENIVNLEPWNRRHRKVANYWGKPEIPQAWMVPSHEERGEQQSYGIIMQNGELVGRLTLRNIDYDRRSARLGIFLKPGMYGKGLGTQAIRMVQQHWAELRLDVHYRNLRAVTCYLRCGFKLSSIEDKTLEMVWRTH
jgi:RimJ/RimL family protein N-acetyltransferase